MKTEAQQFGGRGEDLATDYLIGKGYKIVDRNYRRRGGEIDIVAEDPVSREIVFVEVKARRNQKYGPPEEAMNERKIQKMEETALHWLAKQKREREEWRLDLLALEADSNGKQTLRHSTHLS